MSNWLAILGSIIAAFGTVPYVIETVKGKTKPRIVTWLTWSLLLGVAAAGSFADGQVGSGVFSLLGSVATGSIVIAGLRYGDRSFTFLDICCLAGVIAGLFLWQIFDSPAVAVWAAIIIDAVGLIPTYRHAWESPQQETLITYVLVCLGGFLTVGAVVAGGGHSITAIGYPMYAGLSMGLCAAVIVWRSKNQRLETVVSDA